MVRGVSAAATAHLHAIRFPLAAIARDDRSPRAGFRFAIFARTRGVRGGAF
jgi:hypothetical protein